MLRATLPAFALLFATCAVADEQPSKPKVFTGYVFVDGCYIAPPYNVSLNDDHLSLNEHEFSKDDFDLSEFEMQNRRGEDFVARGSDTLRLNHRSRIR